MSAATAPVSEDDLAFHIKVLPYVLAKLPMLGIESQCKVIAYVERLLHSSWKSVDSLLKSASVDPKDIVSAVFQGINSCEKEHEMVPELLLRLCELVFLLTGDLPTSLQGVVSVEALTTRLIELAYLKCQEYKLRAEAPPPLKIHEFEYEMFEKLGSLLERYFRALSVTIDVRGT